MTWSRRWILIAAIFLIVAAGGYSAYWFWLTGQVAANLEAWMQARQAEGYQVRMASMAKGGFPFRAEVLVREPSVAHADQGVTWHWQSPELTVSAPVYRFDRLDLHATGPSRTTIESRAPGQGAAAGAATVIVAAESWTELDYNRDGIRSVASTSRDVSIAEPDARPVRAGRIHVEAAAAAPGGSAKPLAIRVDNVVLPDLVDSPLGNEIAEFAAKGTLQGPFPNGPLPQAIRGWRDEGGVLDLTEFRIVWSAVRFKGSGTLALDDALRPVGAFGLRVAGYNWFLNQLVDRHQLNPANAEIARSMLSALAQQKGNEDGVPIPLRIQSGHVWVGPKAVADVHPVL